MLQKYIHGRSAVFIDASNIFHSQKRLGWQIDFKKLKSYLEKQSPVWKISYYTAYDPKNKKQLRFLDFLEITGFKIRKKAIKFIKDNSEDGGHHKGNLDIELAVEAILAKDNFDTFILFSGDSDFEPLIKQLRKFGKKIIVLSTKGHIAIELIQQAKFVDLKKFRKDFAK